jgi:hypothetical protein
MGDKQNTASIKLVAELFDADVDDTPEEQLQGLVAKESAARKCAEAVNKRIILQINEGQTGLLANYKTRCKLSEVQTSSQCVSVQASVMDSAYVDDKGKPIATGLRWMRIDDPPSKGEQLANAKLLQALSKDPQSTSVIFTEEEWTEFAVSDLRFDHYVAVHNKYYQPIPVTKEPTSQNVSASKLQRWEDPSVDFGESGAVWRYALGQNVLFEQELSKAGRPETLSLAYTLQVPAYDETPGNKHGIKVKHGTPATLVFKVDGKGKAMPHDWAPGVASSKVRQDKMMKGKLDLELQPLPRTTVVLVQEWESYWGVIQELKLEEDIIMVMPKEGVDVRAHDGKDLEDDEPFQMYTREKEIKVPKYARAARTRARVPRLKISRECTLVASQPLLHQRQADERNE